MSRQFAGANRRKEKQMIGNGLRSGLLVAIAQIALLTAFTGTGTCDCQTPCNIKVGVYCPWTEGFGYYGEYMIGEFLAEMYNTTWDPGECIDADDGDNNVGKCTVYNFKKILESGASFYYCCHYFVAEVYIDDGECQDRYNALLEDFPGTEWPNYMIF